jgi:hypothetical protein
MNGAALLSGFPARRARAVLQELLAQPAGNKVFVLVHSARHEEARALLAQPPFLSPRIELLDGDPTAIDFGLAAATYLRLAREVRHVHAAYSLIDPDHGEALSEQVNVGSARELGAFAACASELAAIVQYSSVFVAGQRRGLVREDELEAGQSFKSPVDRSLAIAERMLRRSGAPTIVVRAGHLLGGDELASDALSAPYVLLGLVASSPSDVALPLPPRPESVLSTTPVDYLAKLGLFAALRGEVGVTFHATDPGQPTIGRFIEILAERTGRGLESGFNAPALTRILMSSPATRLVPQNLRGILDVLTSNSRYATEQAERLTASGGPSCPSLEHSIEQLLPRVDERIKNGTFFTARQREAPFLVS